MTKSEGNRPPAWAEGTIKLIYYYGTRIKFIRMAAEGDIQKFIAICRKQKLNFWSRVFEEYSTILKKLEFDSGENIFF